MILVVLFGLQGVALVHYLVKRRNASVAWLAGLYVALAIIPQPASGVVLGLALAGLSDTWVDYRKRFGMDGNLPAGSRRAGDRKAGRSEGGAERESGPSRRRPVVICRELRIGGGRSWGESAVRDRRPARER